MEKWEEEEEEQSSLFNSRDSMFMDPTNSDVWGNIERWRRTELAFITAEIQILQLKATFIKVLLICRGKWHIQNGNLEHLLSRILVGFQNADLDFQRLWVDCFIWNPLGFFNRTSLENMDGLLSGLRERLKLLQPDIDEVCTVLSKSSGCDADMLGDSFAREATSEPGRIQEELEKIKNCSRPDEFFFFLQCRFMNSQSRLLLLSEKLEIQTYFKNEIKELFSGSRLVNHLACRLDNETSLSGPFIVPDEAGPLEDETRFGKTSIGCKFGQLIWTFFLEVSHRVVRKIWRRPLVNHDLLSKKEKKNHDLWLLRNRGLINSFLRQMEAKKKMTDTADGPLEDETRFDNKLKMIETRLKMIKTKTKLICPLRNEVRALRLKVSLLRVILSSKGMWHTEDGSLKTLLTRIRSLSQSLDASLSSMQETLQLLRPDIQQVYTILSESSSILVSVTSAKGIMKKLNSLRLNVNILLIRNAELVAPVKKELEAVKKRLEWLTYFRSFIAKRCSKPEELRDLLIHAEFPTVKMSCLFYLCSVDDKMMKDVKMQLSFELQKFSSARPREIYIKALKASKSEKGSSTWVDVFDLEFFYSLRDYLLELSDTELSFMTFTKNQIVSLHEELRILTISFAMDKSSEDQMPNNLLERINAAIIDIGCVIYSLHNDEKNRDEAGELKTAVSQLQDTIKIAKEDARKAYDMYLPYSLRPKFSRTNVQDFIGFLLEISQFEGFDSKHPLERQFGVVRHEIRSLNEAFNEFTAKQPSDHEELLIQNTHFSDIEYLIRYVITSFFYRGGTHWSHKLGLFNVIEEIRMIKMELKNLQNNMPKIEDQLRWPETLGLKSTKVASKSSRSITDMNSEATMENLNFLLEKIEDLLRCNTKLIAPIQEELKTIQKSLRFLRNFLGFTAKWCSKLENLKDLLIHAQFLSESISCLLYPCSFNNKMNDQMAHKMKKQLSSELQKFSPVEPDVGKIYINSLKASKSVEPKSSLVDEFELGFLDSLRDYILDLSDTKFSFITSNKEQILSLIEELQFVAIFFAMDKSLEEHFDQMSNNLLERIIILIINTGCVIYSLHNLDQDRDKSSHMKIAISDLQDMVKIAKEYARKAYGMYLPKSLWSIFPRTNGQGFIGFLLRNLKELQSTKLKLTYPFQNADQILVAPLKHHIEVALKELLFLREEFTETAKHPNQFEELQSQWTHFVGTAYQTEYIVDSFLGGGTGPLYHHKLELFDVIEEIKTIKMDLEATKNKMKNKTSVQKPSCFPSRISLDVHSPQNNAVLKFKERMPDEQAVSKLVIFGKQAEEILEKLTNRSQKLNFLSIVGMPGIGKTTLADSVIQHDTVMHHFHVLARCSVSQVHDKSRMLREILGKVTDESKQYDDDDLEQKLYQRLKCRRYLIFFDDMWDIRAWEDIRVCFPDDENGSRIMFTSRFESIASQAGLESITYTFHLSPLSEDKSWEMLQMKVFGSQNCLPELVSVGRKIAATCKGLPLTVDLIAGILRATKRKNWNEVAESMMPRLFGDPQGRCRNVLELSYQDLPNELKPCFLYFAAFPENADVPARKLFSLWIAEGFVQLQKNDLRSLEKAAEDILNDLIARSLVTVSRRKPLGGVKGTRVHDLLHEFALTKAREESFMMIIDGKAMKAQWQEQYRLCIRDPRMKFISYSSRVRAVICYESRLNLSVFKLLRVLDIVEVSPAIFILIHLRFLAIRSSKRWILSEIHKLCNLETFILECCSDYGYLLLDKFCNMVRLRHFKVGNTHSWRRTNHFSFGYKKENILEKSSLFDNLRTLCGLQLSYAEEIEKILKLMPNLVKLKVKFYNRDRKCYPFFRLDFLKKLESLDVTHDDSQNPCKITSFPPYLKKLVVSKFGVPWTEISEMGNFEYLEVLKLKDDAFKGPKWDMVDGQFPKLKCLSLHKLYNIEEWNPSEDQLSCLEQLHVEWCTKLKELLLV